MLSFNIISRKQDKTLILDILLSYSFCDFCIFPPNISLKRNDQINHFNKLLLAAHTYYSFKWLVKSIKEWKLVSFPWIMTSRKIHLPLWERMELGMLRGIKGFKAQHIKGWVEESLKINASFNKGWERKGYRGSGQLGIDMGSAYRRGCWGNAYYPSQRENEL